MKQKGCFCLYSIYMSLATFKKKSVVISGTNISGKPVYSYFIPSGPFGPPTSTNSVMLIQTSRQKAVSGFSLNGVHRNPKFFSPSTGTPFRGPYAKGNGGSHGKYYNEPLFNVNLATGKVEAGEVQTNKNSVLSTYGMLRKKYRYLYSGKYPHYWVQPNYGTSNLSANTSQGLYIHNLTSTYSRYVDTNAEAKYVNYIKNCGINEKNLISNGNNSETLKKLSTNSLCDQGLFTTSEVLNYTKFLHIPQSSSQYTTRIQRKCVDPLNFQKPYPGPTNGSQCNSTSEVNTNIVTDSLTNKELEVFLEKNCN